MSKGASPKKRQLEDTAAVPKAKKAKLAPKGEGKKDKSSRPEKTPKNTTSVVAEEIDFPRGGGTSYTPLEVKTIRAEAVKEADEELFKKGKKLRRKSDVKGKGKAVEDGGKGDAVRVEHLNYKRISVGMKIMGQILSIQPLVLVVSLPNQLLGHIPITQISTELTRALETMDMDSDDQSEAEREEEEEEEETVKSSRVPDLQDIFSTGQYVRCVVSAVHAPGAAGAASGMGRGRDEAERASRRVELSLVPEQVNVGVAKMDLKPGFTLSCAVASVEDHGYILTLGVPDVSGFLSFKDAQKVYQADSRLHVGRLLDVAVSKLSSNGRTCNVTLAPNSVRASSLSEVSTVTSVLPGELVQCLITAISSLGLNVQVLGFFDGTIDEYHLPPGDFTENFKPAQKVKARVLYEVPGSSPPRFALSLAEHIVNLRSKAVPVEGKDGPLIQEAYPVGTILEAVKVVAVESERGLSVEVQPGVRGFVHISHVSDDHVPSLSPSSGSWKVNTSHRVRVTGYIVFDGLLQLSMRQSVLEQKFLQVSDVNVGEVIKGTVKRLADSALFVSISGNVDGVVFPNHYADITLKQPQKRFKPGASIKCRVLTVDPERRRVALTAKKTLVESDLPIISQFEDAKVGVVTHAVVFRVSERRLQIEFFNNIKGSVPLKEASEALVGPLSNSFSVGKPVKVRIIAVHPEDHNITASIRQASATFDAGIADISGVEIGSTVEGVVSEVHKENAILTLQPTQIRALLSLKNLANQRSVPVAQLRGSLKVGEALGELVVVTRSPEKGFVIVANRPKTKPALEHKQALTLDTITVGQIVGGRVLRQHRKGTLVKLSSQISGTLHPADASDDYETGTPFPNIDTIVRAAVLAIDIEKKHLTLSTRPSRLRLDEKSPVVDREIAQIADLKPGETVRGFVKSIAEHGLFVTLGRDVDARVQIKELFDEYVKEWKPRFQVNQLVKGRILSVDPEKKQVEMTFRSGDLSRKAAEPSLTLADFHEGEKIDGRVKKVEDYGLFVEIVGSKVSGLCHKSELSDNKNADITLALRSFREGDRVRAIILSIDTEKRRIAFGLKPSYFSDENLEPEEDESEGDKENAEPLGVVDDADMADVPGDDGSEAEASPSEPEDDSDVEPMAVDLEPVSRLTTSKPALLPVPSLNLQGGFQWTGGYMEQDDASGSDSSDDSDADDTTGKKRRKKRKGIELDLTADMHSKMPESNNDFERVLLGSPNSSYLWIQYMSFQLQLSEVDKAREIAKRALKTINFREEKEKLNVWIALLNLENIYGTEESLEAAFKDAARHCDSKTVHLRLAAILDQAEKFDKAQEQYKKTCKKFSHSSKVWTLFGEFYLRRGDIEEARKLLPRSLQSLEKRKHLKTISKFAQLEYKLGDPERGKTIFEGIIDSHPKRWDLWSIYIDMEAAQKDVQSIRSIFDRVLARKMTSHKAKSFFKKWLSLERKIGDEDGAEAVKAKAVEWTRRAAGAPVDEGT
ncbi:nucleic acid-binding protein [Auriscalpium vulgare]|uniref:Nucleic acid-binding protein n=1 Tax=Auriscalpium vulgare TaxID=40419 RepID=A0ACB8RSX5_9AGAM|nr:nucleic acid-binding protein [Auriscalpium vulgare]